MARRSDHTREELKKMAISVGKIVIAQEGFNNFSARKVAKEIGYTVGTLYNIFDNHDDLILHVNAAILIDMHQFISKNMNKWDSGTKAVKNLSALYVTFARDNYNCWRAIFEFNLPQDKELPNWYKEKIQALYTPLETALLSQFKNDTEKTHRAAKVLWAGIHGICELVLTGKLELVGVETVQVLTDSLIDHYL